MATRSARPGLTRRPRPVAENLPIASLVARRIVFEEGADPVDLPTFVKEYAGKTVTGFEDLTMLTAAYELGVAVGMMLSPSHPARA